MLLPLRRSLFAAASASGGLRRALSTAGSDSRRPPWALIHRISGTGPDGVGASVSLASPPSPSSILVPEHVYGLDAHPDEEGCTNILGCGVHAASAEGLLLLTPFTTRYRLRPHANLNLPVHELLKTAPLEVAHQFLYRFVCNPATGELFRLPDFDNQEKQLGDHHLGIVTDAAAAGPNGLPERYAVAQLSNQDGVDWGKRRFVLRRFASETGKWDRLVLPSNLPRGRRMHLNHEVVAFRGRLWWTDVSWGAVSVDSPVPRQVQPGLRNHQDGPAVDPFSDRPELRSVQLPGESTRPRQGDEEVMRQMVKRRRLGVSDGRLCYAEVAPKEPYLIKLFTLDEDSGRWTLEQQVPFADLLCRGGFTPAPLLGAIDPVNFGHLYLSIDREFTVAVDMPKMEVTGAAALGEVRPAKNSSSFLLSCVLADGLASYRIPGSKEGTENKTLAEVLVRSGGD